MAFIDQLYIAGPFTSAGGVSARGLAAWSGTDWRTFGDVSGGWAKTLVTIGRDLYVGGDFANVAGLNIPYLVCWSGSEWSSLGTGVRGPSASVLSLARNGTDLFVAGTFISAGGKPATGFSRWSIENLPLSIRIVSPATDSNYGTTQAVQIEVQTDDPDGSVKHVDFFANSTFIGSASNRPFSLVWSNHFPGLYAITAKAVDELQSASSLPINIRILPPANDLPPSVSLVSPVSGQTFLGGSNLNLTAETADPDGGVIQVNFFNGPVLLGSVRETPFQLPLTNITAGNYMFLAEAVDDLGASAFSAPVYVSVLRTNRPPFIQWISPLPGQQFTLPTNIAIKLDASDPDGRVARLALLDGETLLTWFNGPGPYTFAWPNPAPGVHELNAQAFDEAGGTSSQRVGIVINGPGNHSPAQAIPTTEPKGSFWVTDGTVRAILETNGIVYIGGDFTHVGPLITGSVTVDLSSNPPNFDHPIAEGTVNTIVQDGIGGYFMGGSFNSVAGIGRSNLAHVTADRRLDLKWVPLADGPIDEILSMGGVLYLRGDFNAVNGQYRRRLAALRAATGEVLPWNPLTDGAVDAIAATPKAVYIGGRFNYVSGKLRQFIAAIDPDIGEATDWHPVADAPVHRVLYAFGQLYAAGDFRYLGGQQQVFLAALDPITGQPTVFQSGVDGQVLALAASSNALYVGGYFRLISGAPREYLAALDPISGRVLPFNPNANDSVAQLAVLNGTVYAYGDFSNIGRQDRNRIAALDATSGDAQPLDLRTQGRLTALATVGSRVLAAGWGRLTEIERQHLAAIDAATGIATQWAPSVDQPVWALTFSSNVLYCAGDFTAVNDVPRMKVAALNTATGQVLPWKTAVSGRVQALAVSGDALYLGGHFSAVGEQFEQSRNNAASFDLATGAVLPWNPNFNDGVFSILPFSNQVYAAGVFTKAGGQARNYSAAVDPKVGNVGNWDPNADAAILQLLPLGSQIVAAGAFHSIGGRARDSLAMLDPETGAAALWTASPNGSVVSVAVANDLLFAGGQYTSIGGLDRTNLSALDTRIDSMNTTAWNPFVDNFFLTSIISTLATSRNTVYAGGYALIGRDLHPYLAAYDLPPRVLLMRISTAGMAQLTIDGAPGRFYALETSTNLFQWNVLMTNYGPFISEPLPLTSQPSHYFRAVVP